MRNLKRALSLALASVMLMGMMVVGSSAASYTDVDSADNVEAIEVLKAVGIMTGDTNGNFNPDQKVTRNEMAVVMANLLSLRVADFIGATTPFTDVPEWAQRYVAACFADGIISGYSATWFGAEDNVTAAQAALMLMKALGYFQFAPDFGDDWQVATIRQASRINLFDGVNVGAETALTRNQLAKLVLNALEADMVRYSGDQGTNITLPDGSSIVTGYTIQYDPITTSTTGTPPTDPNNYAGAASGTDGYGTQQLCERLYGNDLKKDSTSATAIVDDFGRPGYTWTYEGEDVHFAEKTPVVTFTAATKPADVGRALSNYYLLDNAGTPNRYRIDNVTSASYTGAASVVKGNGNGDAAIISPSSQTVAAAVAALTGDGKVVEFYADSSNVITKVVTITYKVGEVTNVTTTRDRTTYTISNTPAAVDYVDEALSDTIVFSGSIAKNDIVTYVVAGGKTYVYATDSVTGVQTAKTSDGKITVDGTQYTLGTGVNQNVAGTTAVSPASFNNSSREAVYYIDHNGFVVETTSTAAASDYAFVIGVNGKLSTTVDGSTPSVEARVLLMDGTVGVYNVEVAEVKAGDGVIGTDARNSPGGASGTSESGSSADADWNSVSSKVKFNAGDYYIKGTDIMLYDAPRTGSATTNDTASVDAAGDLLQDTTFGYSISGDKIELESLTALPAVSSPTTDGTVYAVTLSNVNENLTRYTENTDKTILADRNTKFVVYNQDKKTATVYTGASSLPTATNNETGYAVLKAGSTANTGTASVVFISTPAGFTADATDDYVYIDATEYTQTLVGDDTKYIYTGTYADGSTITLAPSNQIGTGLAGDSGLFTYNENNEVNTTALANTGNAGAFANTYYIYDATLTVTGDLLGVTVSAAESFYNITDETLIVYIDGDLAEVNGNGGFVVLAERNGAATSDVAAIFITVD